MIRAEPAAWIDSYRLSLRDALEAARRDGYRGVLLNSTRAELNPREFGATARRHLSKYLRDLGLSLDGVAASWSGAGLADAARADERMAHLRATLELCCDLGVKSASASLGGLGQEKPAGIVLDSLRAVAELADRTGVAISIHAPGDDPRATADHIRQIGCPGVLVAFDTAGGPVAASDAGALAGLIGLAQFRDVRRSGGRVEEVEFGQGDVDFAAVLGLLSETGFPGPIVVRRDSANAGVDALRRGREYISTLVNRSPPR